MKMLTLTILVCAVLGVLGDVSHVVDQYSTTTPPPPPHPYAFSYTAGRYPGHVDRQHTEEGDGAGVVRGSFSYVDPRHEVRTVEYVADSQGFHPSLSHPQATHPLESEAVKLGREQHEYLFAKIAEEHAQQIHPVLPADAPQDSAAVAYAKDKHAYLFATIAEEHARIGAEREAERLAFEAASAQNHLQVPNEEYYQNTY